MSVRMQPVWLDYAGAGGLQKLLANLSAVVWADPFLWSASDEGRTVECLKPHRNGFRLHRQIKLDDVFRGLPGKAENDEADLESIDVADGRLWISGSHCIVRRQVGKTGNNTVDPRFRVRKSRRLLGNVAIADLLAGKVRGYAMPYSGRGSLRHLLARDQYIAPFIDLPSKENGLDIEGLARWRTGLLVGLRGPLVDSIAMVIELGCDAESEVLLSGTTCHFLDLDGLGVRDLARWDNSIIVLAGPVSAAAGPFRLYRWRPRRTASIQRPQQMFEWGDHVGAPEGICRKHDGVLVVYDTGNNPGRISGSRVRADWLTGL